MGLKMVVCFSVFFSCVIVIPSTLSARILGVISTPSFSHQTAFRPLWRELSLRGHRLTVLTTNPMNDPSLINLTEIDLHSSYNAWAHMDLNKFVELNPWEMFNQGMDMTERLISSQLGHPEVQALIHNNSESFDLVIAEGAFLIMTTFAERFRCPLIQVFSFDPSSFIYELIGNPSHPVLNPDVLTPFSENLSLLERVTSALFSLVVKFGYYMFVIPLQQTLINKYFGDGYPYLLDIARNTSMIFRNANPIFYPVRPLLPSIIRIGGDHMQKPKELPEELKAQLDEAKKGFIYFSLGGNIKSKSLSKRVLSILLETFRELPYTVLWKFEIKDLPEKPDNVLISKWFPQNDILRHPNIKLFITQGGLQSMEEAIANHVPMIGMPFSWDQPRNVKCMESKGFGLYVDYKNIDKESFKRKILEVITDPKYRKRVKEVDELVRDEPMTGLKRAVWWTEYVLRHKGAKHLRSPALDLPTYQYFLLDVVAFCLTILLSVIYMTYFLFKYLYTLFKFLLSKPKIKVS